MSKVQWWPEAALAVYNPFDDWRRRTLLNLRSLGLRSDLALLSAEIEDRGDYLVVRSPLEPTYYWGNLLVFSAPPKAGDLARWQALFDEEFAALPKVLHKTFTWDMADAPGDTSDFVDAGYRLEHSVVLTAKCVVLPKFPNPAVEVRSIRSEAEWQEVEELQVRCRDEGHQADHYRDFIRGRLREYRKRVDAGQGEWHGAFLDKEMVANLGLFRTGSSARFQVVITHPEHRREGVCGTLVHAVAKEALERPDVDTLIMVADSEYHAARIYESLGFAPAEVLSGVCLWPA